VLDVQSNALVHPFFEYVPRSTVGNSDFVRRNMSQRDRQLTAKALASSEFAGSAWFSTDLAPISARRTIAAVAAILPLGRVDFSEPHAESDYRTPERIVGVDAIPRLAIEVQ
jgi:hypothetical protein